MESNPQDSLVTSSEDVLHTEYSSSTSCSRSASGKRGVHKRKCKEISDQLPWLQNFNRTCRSLIGSCSIKLLLTLISVYTEHISREVVACYSKPNRAAKLKESMIGVLNFFHHCYIRMKGPLDEPAYFEKMSDLLTMYMDMEIKASRRGKESVKKITSKLVSSLFVILNNSSDYILDTVLKARFTVKSYSEICIPLFRRVTNLAIVQDVTYVRCLLVFKLWKRLVPKGEERNSVNKLAVAKLSPPPPQLLEMVKYGLFTKVLPSLPPNKQPDLVTRFFMTSKFNVKSAIKAFMKLTFELKMSELSESFDAVEIFDEAIGDENVQDDKDNSFLESVWLDVSKDLRTTQCNNTVFDFVFTSKPDSCLENSASRRSKPKLKKTLDKSKSERKKKIRKDNMSNTLNCCENVLATTDEHCGLTASTMDESLLELDTNANTNLPVKMEDQASEIIETEQPTSTFISHHNSNTSFKIEEQASGIRNSDQPTSTFQTTLEKNSDHISNIPFETKDHTRKNENSDQPSTTCHTPPQMDVSQTAIQKETVHNSSSPLKQKNLGSESQNSNHPTVTFQTSPHRDIVLNRCVSLKTKDQLSEGQIFKKTTTSSQTPSLRDTINNTCSSLEKADPANEFKTLEQKNTDFLSSPQRRTVQNSNNSLKTKVHLSEIRNWGEQTIADQTSTSEGTVPISNNSHEAKDQVNKGENFSDPSIATQTYSGIDRLHNASIVLKIEAQASKIGNVNQFMCTSQTKNLANRVQPINASQFSQPKTINNINTALKTQRRQTIGTSGLNKATAPESVELQEELTNLMSNNDKNVMVLSSEISNCIIEDNLNSLNEQNCNDNLVTKCEIGKDVKNEELVISESSSITNSRNSSKIVTLNNTSVQGLRKPDSKNSITFGIGDKINTTFKRKITELYENSEPHVSSADTIIDKQSLPSEFDPKDYLQIENNTNLVGETAGMTKQNQIVQCTGYEATSSLSSECLSPKLEPTRSDCMYQTSSCRFSNSELFTSGLNPFKSDIKSEKEVLGKSLDNNELSVKTAMKQEFQGLDASSSHITALKQSSSSQATDPTFSQELDSNSLHQIELTKSLTEDSQQKEYQSEPNVTTSSTHTLKHTPFDEYQSAHIVFIKEEKKSCTKKRDHNHADVDNTNEVEFSKKVEVVNINQELPKKHVNKIEFQVLEQCDNFVEDYESGSEDSNLVIDESADIGKEPEASIEESDFVARSNTNSNEKYKKSFLESSKDPNIGMSTPKICTQWDVASRQMCSENINVSHQGINNKTVSPNDKFSFVGGGSRTSSRSSFVIDSVVPLRKEVKVLMNPLDNESSSRVEKPTVKNCILPQQNPSNRHLIKGSSPRFIQTQQIKTVQVPPLNLDSHVQNQFTVCDAQSRNISGSYIPVSDQVLTSNESINVFQENPTFEKYTHYISSPCHPSESAKDESEFPHLKQFHRLSFPNNSEFKNFTEKVNEERSSSVHSQYQQYFPHEEQVTNYPQLCHPKFLNRPHSNSGSDLPQNNSVIEVKQKMIAQDLFVTDANRDPLCLVVKKDDLKETNYGFDFVFPVAQEIEISSATDGGLGEWSSPGVSEIGHPDWPIANEQNVSDTSMIGEYVMASDNYTPATVSSTHCCLSSADQAFLLNSIELEQVLVDFTCLENVQSCSTKDKYSLHTRTLEVDYNLCCSQHKFKEFYLSQEVPPTIPVPYPPPSRGENSKASVRCACDQCSENYKKLLNNYNTLNHFKSLMVKPSNTNLTIGETPVSEKDQNLENDCSLPLKKRKTLTSSKINDEPQLISYPNTPMISIAQLELVGYEKQEVTPPSHQNQWALPSINLRSPINLRQSTLSQQSLQSEALGYSNKRKTNKRRKSTR